MKLLLVGTCHMDPIVEACRHSNVQADHMLMGFQPHDGLQRDFGADGYDACVIGPVLRHVLEFSSGTNNELAFWRLEPSEIEGFKARTLVYLGEKMASIATRLGSIPLIFLSFIEPSISYVGESFRFDPTLDFKEFIHEVNKGIRSIAEKMGAAFLDVNISLDAIGRQGAQCDVMSASTHASFIGDWDYGADSRRIVAPVKPSEFFGSGDRAFRYGKHLLERITKTIQSQKGLTIKLIITDLDDTIWRGVAAESDFDLTMRREGWPYGLVEALLIFKKRGGMLAICSKNNPEETASRFSDIWGKSITLDDFVSVKIGWNSKSDSIQEILREVNVLPESVAFLDDNPREIDEVLAKFPAIQTFGFNHYTWRNAIISNASFSTPLITHEARNKTSLIKSKIARDDSLQSLSREEWLRSLQIKQRVGVISNHESSHFPRAFELLNKTNQFNTTGRRWAGHEIQELFSRGGFLLVTWLSDKSTNNGLIGVAVIENDRITHAVLSCRVFGLGAEIILIREACRAILLSHKVVYGYVVATEKNFASLDIFARCGFQKFDEGQFAASLLPPAPTWIEVVEAPYGT